MLPFAPETLLDMQNRYPAAIAEAFDDESVILGNLVGPGESRRCVFDFAMGLRLIVSRDVSAGWHALVVTASPVMGGLLWEQVERGELDPAGFAELAIEQFRAISGDREPITFAGFRPPKMFPVWFRPLEGRA